MIVEPSGLQLSWSEDGLLCVVQLSTGRSRGPHVRLGSAFTATWSLLTLELQLPWVKQAWLLNRCFVSLT